MKHKLLIICSFVLSLLISSCIFSPSIRGNGKVVQETRSHHKFDAIKVSRGMNVYISKGNASRVIVKADENLMQVITTEVKDGVLKISSEANIKKAKLKNVYVTTPKLESIKASAGSNVYSETLLDFENLDISTSSGSNMHLEIETKNSDISASSGSNIHLKGKATSVETSASSGANIKAGDLKSSDCTADVSSGANIWIYADNSISGSASSGGNVFYYGNPGSTDISQSSGGNMIKK